MDSSVWIDYFNGKITWQTEIFDQMLQHPPVCTGDRKTIDVIIATFCIIENIRLLHDDKDFEPMVEHLALKTVLPSFFI